MNRSTLTAAPHRLIVWLMPILLSIGTSGCGGGGDRHHYPAPQEPLKETGLFLIAGDICNHCTGSADGTGSAAKFNNPEGIAADGAGNLYVAERASSTIRKVTLLGVVTTLAGAAGVCGSADGLATAAQFCQPQDIAVDKLGNLYVADTANSTVRKITATGVVSTLAGRAGECGSTDGSGAAARFCLESGIAVDKAGNLFVADTGNSTVRKITAAGVVSTVAGVAGNSGNVLGPLPGGLSSPLGITVIDTDTLALTSRNLVLKLVVPPN